MSEKLATITPSQVIRLFHSRSSTVKVNYDPDKSTSLPPRFNCSLSSGMAFVDCQEALELFPGSKMTPKDFADWYHMTKKTRLALTGNQIFAEPLTISAAPDINLRVYSGSTTNLAKTLSRLGSLPQNSEEQLAKYQKAYATIYDLLTADLLPAATAHQLETVIAEDCAASGDTISGFLKVTEKMGTKFDKVWVEVLTATPQAVIWLVETFLASSTAAEIRIGYLSWGLSRGDKEGHGKNYIVKTDAVNVLPGQFIVGDIGDRSRVIDTAHTAYRPDVNKNLNPRLSVFPKEGRFLTIFPEGGWLPAAFNNRQAVTRKEDCLPIAILTAKRASSPESFGVMFSHFLT